MNLNKILLFIYLAIMHYNINVHCQSTIQKQGGICFRVDDNHNISEYLTFASVFDKYNLPFTFALNLGESLNQTYINGIKELQRNGHEMMDHTPNHRTNYFYTKFNPNEYLNLQGVDHLVETNKICLEHEKVELTKSKYSGLGKVWKSSLISNENGAFKNLSAGDIYVYFLNLDTTVIITEVKNKNSTNPDTLRIKDLWNDYINLVLSNNEPYYIFNYNDISLSTDGYSLLARESINLANYYDLELPKTWIQPGGNFVRAKSYELFESMGLSNEIGYVSGAVYPESSLKVFNEYNPNSANAFGMQWGNFKDDTWETSTIKRVIADKTAKHGVLIGHSHFSNLLDGWSGYLDRVDEILSWCVEKNIPVRTYSQWADILYNQIPDPFQNVFPHLGTDKDENNIPDGFNATDVVYEGIWLKNDGIAASNYHSYYINKKGNICFIDDLGGLEKGENEFEIWTRGAPGNFIEVDFKIGSDHEVYKFPAENGEWTRYTLEQSLNGINSLIIPENISLVDITIRCSNYTTGAVKISGMSLKKKIMLQESNLDVTLFLQGAYSGTNEMVASINNLLPFAQPFNCTPCYYSGSEAVNTIPDVNIVDWVLVSLYTEVDAEEPEVRRAGFLRKDGKIVDLDGTSPLRFNIAPSSYFIKVEHRNHLSVMSAEPVSITNTQ